MEIDKQVACLGGALSLLSPRHVYVLVIWRQVSAIGALQGLFNQVMGAAMLFRSQAVSWEYQYSVRAAAVYSGAASRASL